MSSFEDEKKESLGKEDFNADRLKIPMLKYFWQASPLSHSKNNSIHKFLSEIKVLERFSDYELRLFSGFLHRRNFAAGERIFREGDSGFGFYIIFSGSVDISGQPAGSNMKYKLTTHNQALTKQTRIYGTSMAWA